MNSHMKKIVAVCTLLGAMLFAGNTADARWGSRYYRPYYNSYRNNYNSYRHTTPYYWSRPNHWHSNYYYRAPAYRYYW